MKFFTTIMGIYLLALSCVPCNDRDECNVNSAPKISAYNDHQSHQHSDEACTPFCTCLCCAASAYYQPLAKTQLIRQVLQTEKYPICNVSFLSQEFSAIWQPPKIA